MIANRRRSGEYGVSSLCVVLTLASLVAKAAMYFLKYLVGNIS